MKSSAKKVIVIGAGFAGMYTAKALLPYVRSGDIELTIINKTNYFLFTPLLHEVATGGLSPASVSESLREIFGKDNVAIFENAPTAIDCKKKIIILPEQELRYDYLVVATGAMTHYYNTPGAEEYALTLKDLADAIRIKNSIIESFEAATRAKSDEERKALLSFVVVGGGATGVELAGELPQFCSLLLGRYFRHTPIAARDISIKLITAGSEILSQFDPKLRSLAMAQLAASGVSVHLNMAVSAVTNEGVMTKDGISLPAKNIFWLAGVRPSCPPFTDNAPAPLSPSGRIHTDEYLRVAEYDGVFAFGDVASKTGANAKELPMLAQVATQQAPIVAHNIMASIKNHPLSSFSFKNKGSMISLGQWFAVGEIYSIDITGKIAWWIWRTVYLFKFPSWRKRFSIASEWTAHLFYPRDITKPR